MSVRNLVVDALRRLEALASFDLGSWDRLIRQARRGNLLGRICMLLDERELLKRVPTPVRHHLESARTVAERQASAVRCGGKSGAFNELCRISAYRSSC